MLEGRYGVICTTHGLTEGVTHCPKCSPLGVQAFPAPDRKPGDPGHFATQFMDKPAPLTESQRRKLLVVFDGFMQYYPRAMKEVANYSRLGNDKHNPGQRLHWAKEKSQDQANCVARHLLDIGPTWMERDPEFGTYHAVALAWRSMALLETVLEAEERGISVEELQKRWRDEAAKSPGTP